MSQTSFEANTLQFQAAPAQDSKAKLQAEFEELQHHCKALQQDIQQSEAKLPTMASPAFRSNAQNRIRLLRSQYKNKLQRQRTLGLQLRMQLVRQHLEALRRQQNESSAQDFLAPLLQDSLGPIQTALTQPPYGGSAWQEPLNLLERHLQSLFLVWQAEHTDAQLRAALRPVKQSRFPEKANPQEKALLKRYILLIENALLQLMGSEKPAAPTLKKIPTGLKAERVESTTPQPASKKELPKLKGLGDLQVSFDLAAGKTVVKDQLGVQVNKEKKAFEVLLSEGMDAAEEAFAKLPPSQPLLQVAIVNLSEAVSAEPTRFEPYFSLGYIFASLSDWERAIKLLETAHTISQREDILAFLNEVKASAPSNSNWSA